jgi:hypothetical protein
VAAERGPAWAEANAYARRVGYKLGVSYLAKVGMVRAHDVWRNNTEWVDDAELGPVQRARRDLLLCAATWLYAGTFPPLKLARMSSLDGEHRRDMIVLDVSLLSGEFGEALSVYLHELCHEHGKDGDARFSDALTDAIKATAREARTVLRFQDAWHALALVDAQSLERVLQAEALSPRAQALLHLVEGRSSKGLATG